MLKVLDTLNESVEDVVICDALGPFKALRWRDNDGSGIAKEYQLSCSLQDEMVCVGDVSLWWGGAITALNALTPDYTTFTGKGGLFFEGSRKPILLEDGADWETGICILSANFLAATLDNDTKITRCDNQAFEGCPCIRIAGAKQVAMLSHVGRQYVVTAELDGEDSDCIVMNPNQIIGWSPTLVVEKVQLGTNSMLKFCGTGKIKASPCI